jgi:hypothetical protein
MIDRYPKIPLHILTIINAGTEHAIKGDDVGRLTWNKRLVEKRARPEHQERALRTSLNLQAQLERLL